MTDSHDFPVDLPADPDGGEGALRWTAGILTIATLALALLNAEAIAGWTHDLPPSPGTARVMTAADAWHDATGRLGFGAAHAGLHQLWKRAQASRWPGDSCCAEPQPPVKPLS